MTEATPALIRCGWCGERKPPEAFYSDPRKRSKCRQCTRDWQQEYHRERIEWLREYKTTRGCLDCGYNAHWCALDLDHRPGEEKLYEPSQLVRVTSWEVIFAEVAKCDVVCSNCHRIRTQNRGPANRNHDLNPGLRNRMTPYVRTIPDQLPLFSDLG